MKTEKYSVSAVFTQSNGPTIETALRVMIVDATSEAEALGIAITDFSKELPNYALTLKVVMKVTTTLKTEK